MSLDWGPRPDDRMQDHDVRPAPDSDPATAEAHRPPSRSKGVRMLIRAVIVVALAPFVLSILYTIVPPVSTLMLARWATLRPVERDWMPLDKISPALPRAVIGSEDAKFCSHRGVDWGELRAVINDEDGPSRGASTISMQVVKNLFLWQGFGYVRKPVEVVLAHWLDFIWPKRRMMEVYLNTAEWGPNGVFGAEAISRKAFGKSALQLTPREAAILAAALPNPVVRNSAKPTRSQIRRAGTINARAAQADSSCVSR